MRPFTAGTAWPWAVPVLALVAGFSACTPSYNPDGGPPPRRDGGGDAGPDGGVPDSGPPVCDPLAGTGCDIDAGLRCLWSPANNQVACAVPGSAPHEQTCSGQGYECEVGLACLALPSIPGGKCYKMCNAETRTGCENVQGTSPNYVCIGLDGKSFGVCLGVGDPCDPLADMCAQDDVCSLRGGTPVCVPAGNSNIGDDCSVEPCKKGGICVRLEDQTGLRCFQPCDPTFPRCGTANQVCTGLVGFSFGICQDSEVLCDPLDDMCPQDQGCSIVGTDVKCVPVGTTPLGGSCAMEACQRGGICAELSGGMGPVCLEPCNLTLPMCANAGDICNDIGLPFGLCD